MQLALMIWFSSQDRRMGVGADREELPGYVPKRGSAMRRWRPRPPRTMIFPLMINAV